MSVLKKLGRGAAGDGDGGGDVIVGGEGGGGGEGGAEDANVVIEGGGGSGAVEEEGKFVLRSSVDCGNALDKGSILRSFLIAPLDNGGVIEPNRNTTYLEARVDEGGAWREASCMGADIGGRAG
jgi:hypothetical protein